MKLAIFINSLAGGGAERVAATLANHWARRQWEVTIITLEPQERDFYTLEPAVRRVPLNLADDSAHVLDALARNMQRVWALRQALRQLKPDVALAMMSTPNVLLACAGIGIAGLRTVGSERCYPPQFPLGRVWNTLRRAMYGRLDAVVAVTQEGAGWIGTHTSAKCIAVVPNAVCWPLPDNTPRIIPDALCRPERKVLLAVGRLSHEKNFDLLVDVFSRLGQRHPDWDLVILGDGPDRPALEKQVLDAGLGMRIFMPGIAGNVGQWYARADLFVMTSRFEGFPNALAEALAYGLPSVSFDCDTGPRDIIRHGVDGLLVPPGNAQGLEDALDRVMANRQLRMHMAGMAIEARQRFSIDRIAGMWETLFGALPLAGAVPHIMPAQPQATGAEHE